MSITDQQIQQQFKEILQKIYTRGEESPCIKANDFINEIKQQMMLVVNTSEYRSIDKKDC